MITGMYAGLSSKDNLAHLLHLHVPKRSLTVIRLRLEMFVQVLLIIINFQLICHVRSSVKVSLQMSTLKNKPSNYFMLRWTFLKWDYRKWRMKSLCCACMYANLRVSYLMRIVGVDYPGQPEVSNLEQQLVCVDEYVGRLQISVQDVGWVDELQSPQQLVEQQSSVTCSRAKDRYQDTTHCFYSHSCNYCNNAQS